MNKRVFILALAFIMAATFTVSPTTAKASEKNDAAVTSVAAKDKASTDAGQTDGISDSDSSDEVTADNAEDQEYKESADDTEDDNTDADNTKKEDKADKADKAKSDKDNKDDSKKASSKTVSKDESRNYSDSDLKLLACVIYTEAGNQSYRGKLAVGNVVMNRVKSQSFPDSVHGVIYQPYQFGVCGNSRLTRALATYGSNWGVGKGIFNSCVNAARDALEGKNATADTYYFFCGYSAELAARRPNGVKIGAHYIYR